MQRRNFIRTTCGVATALAFAPVMAEPYFFNQGESLFQPAELNKILKDYFSKIFNAEIDPTISSPSGRYYFAKSFEIELNREKNSVFDFVDQIIVLARECGIDASDLKQGKIPKELTIMPGKIGYRNNNVIGVLNLPELKNYDATFKALSQVSILSRSQPEKWKNLQDIYKVEKSAIPCFEGTLDNNVFRIWLQNEVKYHFEVEQINPQLKLSENIDRNIINLDRFNNVVNEHISTIISDNC